MTDFARRERGMDFLDSRQADERATLLALWEHGSFAAAGRALQRHPTVLSKRLSALRLRIRGESSSGVS